MSQTFFSLAFYTLGPIRDAALTADFFLNQGLKFELAAIALDRAPHLLFGIQSGASMASRHCSLEAEGIAGAMHFLIRFQVHPNPPTLGAVLADD